MRERKGGTVAHQTNKKHTVAGSVTVWAHQTAPRPFCKMVKHTGGFIQETHLNIYIQEQAFATPEEVLMAFKVTNVIDSDTFEVCHPGSGKTKAVSELDLLVITRLKEAK